MNPGEELNAEYGRPLTEAERKILDEYQALCHAMQSGVAFEQERGSPDGTPKHLRTGVNTCKCDHAALVNLLVIKGLIQRDEYFEAIRQMIRKEVDRYERNATQLIGKPITFG